MAHHLPRHPWFHVDYLWMGCDRKVVSFFHPSIYGRQHRFGATSKSRNDAVLSEASRTKHDDDALAASYDRNMSYTIPQIRLTLDATHEFSSVACFRAHEPFGAGIKTHFTLMSILLWSRFTEISISLQTMRCDYSYEWQIAIEVDC